MPAPDETPEAIPAATVVLLRDGAGGLETLMLHRDSQVAFGGMWVFPGGRIDAGDIADDGDEAAARRAAAREAVEECGLAVEPDDLVPLSFWLPPPVAPRRYATWFFVGRAGEGEVLVDEGEIRDHQWLQPGDVLDLRDAGEVDLVPPTWMTLHDLTEVADVEAALALAASRDPLPRYATRWLNVEGGGLALWAGDAGYESGDHLAEGPRHRLWMTGERWRLERTTGP